MKICCISDTHERHRQIKEPLPEADVLIHAGDMVNSDDACGWKALRDFAVWFGNQPHPTKICIAGNHDQMFEGAAQKEARTILEDAGILYLQDSWLVVNGITFYGAPWTPRFFDWAFNVDRGNEIKKKWDLIEPTTQVLITHGPAYGIRDFMTKKLETEHLGCEELSKVIGRFNDLKLHVFGHIHGGYGRSFHSVNAAICNEAYLPVNAPIVVDI